MSSGYTFTSGQMLGGCRILRLLGRGGMGEVYLAEHLSLQKLVALKVLPEELSSPSRVERFIKEARRYSRIDHPNVVVIHDVGSEAGVYYIVMQYVRGKNLSQLLRDHGGPLPWRTAVRIARMAALGLIAVHRQGLIHRNIKPSNVMLSTDSRVILMDSGLIVGTSMYMPPEQCRGEPADWRSDIYSLGATLYQLLTGQAPFQGNRPSEIFANIARGVTRRPLEQVNADVPQGVCDLVAKAMALTPNDRFPAATVMSRKLKGVLRGAISEFSASSDLLDEPVRLAAESEESPDPASPHVPLPEAHVPIPSGRPEARSSNVAILRFALACIIGTLVAMGLVSRFMQTRQTGTAATGPGRPAAESPLTPSDGAPTMSLVNVVELGHASHVVKLLDAGASADEVTADGRSLLIVAVDGGHVDVTRALLEQGADPNLVSESQLTPIMTAARSGQHELVELLASYGADPNQRGPDGTTPLMAAATNGHLETIKVLLDCGADIRAADYDDQSASDHAASAGYDEIAAFLKKAASVDIAPE